MRSIIAGVLVYMFASLPGTAKPSERILEAWYHAVNVGVPVLIENENGGYTGGLMVDCTFYTEVIKKRIVLGAGGSFIMGGLYDGPLDRFLGKTILLMAAGITVSSQFYIKSFGRGPFIGMDCGVRWIRSDDAAGGTKKYTWGINSIGLQCGYALPVDKGKTSVLFSFNVQALYQDDAWFYLMGPMIGMLW